jgi:PhnB protein
VLAFKRKEIALKVAGIPDGFSAVTPYLVLQNASKAIEFYKQAFGAVEVRRMAMGNKIMHAEIQMFGSHIMVSDEFAEYGFKSPQTLGGSPAFIHVYVKDSDAVFNSAIKAGATVLQPVNDQFFGDRHGQLQDPFGYTWTIATHLREVPQAELDQKLKEYMSQMGGE